MASVLVPVTPTVLRWARESVGVSVVDAAARAKITEERLSSWEAGDADPTLAKLRDLAALYQRPLAVFLLPEPPRDYETPRDFRRLPGRVDHAWSRPLHRIYRRALDQQAAALELLEEAGEIGTARVPALTSDLDPEDAGEVVRQVLGVPLAEQYAWADAEKAFARWLTAVEALGVLVMRTSDVEPAEMRGFSIPGDIPVIVVNALDWPRGQVFTLLHEFAHLTLREGGLCDLLEPETLESRRIETWCNAVAAAALMPRGPFVAQVAPEMSEEPGEREAYEAWNDTVLKQLSARWSVSEEAVARRLVTLGQAPLSFYRTKREEYQAQRTDERDAERARRRSRRGGGPPPHRMAIRDRGRPYVRLVLDAYHRDALSMASASRLLSLKVRHLEPLEHEIGS